jgi:hypothetical protein
MFFRQWPMPTPKLPTDLFVAPPNSSNQILQFFVSMNHQISTNLIFFPSRFILFHQVLTLVFIWILRHCRMRTQDPVLYVCSWSGDLNRRLPARFTAHTWFRRSIHAEPAMPRDLNTPTE